MREFVFSQGARVRVRKGTFPMDPTLVGRQGLVFHLDPYKPGRYGVVLDGESVTRDFAQDELEPAG